jgi:hypothetical protein
MGQKAEGAGKQPPGQNKIIYLDYFITVEYDNQGLTATVYKALGEKSLYQKTAPDPRC